MDEELVLLDWLDGVDEGIAVVTLNRPGALNALNEALASAFTRCIKDLATNDRAKVVIVTGKGKAFCAGGDLGAFDASDAPGDFLHDLASTFHDGIVAMRRMGAPFIAAINGPCFGVGLSLACASDFRVAAEHATFAVAFTGVGLSPDSGLPFFLPRITGAAIAAELALLNPVIDAVRARAINLVHDIVPDAMAGAIPMARRLAAMPAMAIGTTKRLLDAAFSDSLDIHLAKELDGVRATGDSADFQEGCTAFLQKRKPRFTGY